MVRPPGPATSRSATSFWTITTSRCTRRARLQHRHDDRHGDVVGQVRDQRPRRARRRAARSSPSGQGVGLDDTDRPASSAPGPRAARAPGGVLLDGQDRRSGVGQRQGQRTEARPDLDHAVAGTDAGQPGDAHHRVGVGHEVLAERPAGVQPVPLHQLARPRERPARQSFAAGVAGWCSESNDGSVVVVDVVGGSVVTRHHRLAVRVAARLLGVPVGHDARSRLVVLCVAGTVGRPSSRWWSWS